MMSRATRKTLIEEIEKIRESRVVVYVTGDRSPAPAQIGDDVVRPLFDHLRSIGHVPKLDFFIYSRGGAIDVPWRINTALRTTGERWNVLIPFRANSAATLLALGADEIVLGRNGELGPIDPAMTVNRVLQRGMGQPAVIQDRISVEDVMAYVRFVKERGGLSDQSSLSAGLSKLVDRIDAVTLGNLYRTHSHIRDVARRMLVSRKEPALEQTIATIVETLAERVYAHGHAIGLATAKEIGLPVIGAPADLDEKMWSLLNEYETDLKLLDPVDAAVALEGKSTYGEKAVISVLESRDLSHEFEGEIHLSGRRQMPPQLNVSISLNLQLPVGAQLPAQAQQTLQQILQAAQEKLLPQAQQAVTDALQAQAPIDDVEAGFRGGRWVRKEP